VPLRRPPQGRCATAYLGPWFSWLLPAGRPAPVDPQGLGSRPCSRLRTSAGPRAASARPAPVAPRPPAARSQRRWERCPRRGCGVWVPNRCQAPSGINLRGRPPGGEHRRCALWGRCCAAHLGPGYGSKIESLAARSS
jgi:hypothetical protein